MHLKRETRCIHFIGLAFWMGVVFLGGGAPALAEPSKAQVTKMWEEQHGVKGRVLEAKSKGGQRTTDELHGKHYLTPIATCWDYDIVELQKCGCRLFLKSSVCCRNGSAQDCELRIGNSKMVDCASYGKPKFGLSGNTEPGDCKSQRTQSACWSRKDLVFGAGYVIGPCSGSSEAQDWPPSFVCPNGQKTVEDFLNKKCGPTPEDCGCTIVEACSSEGGLKCYREWKATQTSSSGNANPEKPTQASSSGGVSPEKAAESVKSATDALKKKLWK